MPAAALLVVAASCRPLGSDSSLGPERLSLMIPASEREVWEDLADRFASVRAGVRLELTEGPNATDLREDLHTAALLARDESLDLVYMDITWTAKFAAAGWLSPLERLFSEAELGALLEADLAAGRHGGHLYRIPVRTDVGLLYYRRDLLEEAGIDPPRSFDDLVRAAGHLQAPPERWGFVWQGSQYEGLICSFLEVLSGHGGTWIDPATLAVGLDAPEAIEAVSFLHRARMIDPISPPGVTTYKEEESRRLFQDGRAVFLRNWPYVWNLAQAEDSPIRGKVGVARMVHRRGLPGRATLGGWGLGISRYSRRRDLAVDFIRFAVSMEGQRRLCLASGFAPARLEAYDDPLLRQAHPMLEMIREAHAGAVSRPAIARYALASDILQRHLSAALSGLDSPAGAMRAAARETRLLLGEESR